MRAGRAGRALRVRLRSGGGSSPSFAHSFIHSLLAKRRSFIHSQHTNTQTVTPSTRHSHLAHITPASFKCSQTCDAYRAHRHGSESPFTTLQHANGQGQTKHKTFTPRTHQASFTSYQHANGHTRSPARRVHAEKARDIETSGVESQLYGHHMSRGSYDPMNCTASCFVIGPHLMMVSETFPLHLFPLGLTTTEKDKGPTGAFTGPRDSSPGTPCVPQLGARRAYPHAPARSRGFPSARERCRPSGAARRSRDSRTRMPLAQAVLVGVSAQTRLLKP